MTNTTQNFLILLVGILFWTPATLFAGIEEHSPDPVPGFVMFDDIILFDPDKADERAADIDEGGREDEREDDSIEAVCPTCLNVQPNFVNDLDLKWKFAQWGIEYLTRPEQAVLTGDDDWETPELLDDTETRSSANPHQKKRRERRDDEEKPSLKNSLGRFEAELEVDGETDAPAGGCATAASPGNLGSAVGVLLLGMIFATRNAKLRKSRVRR